MANVFLEKNRHVVPNFRRFADTVALGELDPTGTTAPTPIPVDLQSHRLDWAAGQNLGVAGDLLSAALVGSELDVPEVKEAAEFVLRKEESSPSLVGAARRVLGTEPRRDLTPLPRLASLLEDQSRQRTYSRIQQIRAALTRFGDDPILLTELARLYLILGNEQKAKSHIEQALRMAPANRFVLRSATRLYEHYDDPERAFYFLTRCAGTRHDPWLTSAELAVAGLIGKTGKVIKSAGQMLASHRFSDRSLAELRAGLGSVVLLDGDRRRSKRLLQDSLQHPNDNALAQVEWALSRERLFDLDVAALDVSRDHEALAIEAFAEQRWNDVVSHCESWLVDMPFAMEPVRMASHVAVVVLDEPAVAVAFSQAGRRASPHDPGLANNYAYALALDGKPLEALCALDAVTESNLGDGRVETCLTATRGLANFRLGRIDEGRRLYMRALDGARVLTDPTVHQVALLNYVREELLAGQALPDVVVEAVRDLHVDKRAVTTQILRDRVLGLLDQSNERQSRE